MKELYKFFKYNGKVMDIIDYDPEIMHIFSRDVLKKLTSGEKGWEEMLPEGIADTIKKKKLFMQSLEAPEENTVPKQVKAKG